VCAYKKNKVKVRRTSWRAAFCGQEVENGELDAVE